MAKSAFSASFANKGDERVQGRGIPLEAANRITAFPVAAATGNAVRAWLCGHRFLRACQLMVPAVARAGNAGVFLDVPRPSPCHGQASVFRELRKQGR